MAARTPSNVFSQNMGGLTLNVAEFSRVDHTDTWGSSITNIIAAWGNINKGDGASGSRSGFAISWTPSSGMFSFWTYTTNTARLFILSRRT